MAHCTILRVDIPSFILADRGGMGSHGKSGDYQRDNSDDGQYTFHGPKVTQPGREDNLPEIRFKPELTGNMQDSRHVPHRKYGNMALFLHRPTAIAKRKNYAVDDLHVP